MKLELATGWFEKNIPHDNPEVGAGLPERGVEPQRVTDDAGIQRENDFVEAHAFGALVRLLRRDRKLTMDQLASAVEVETPELISIELDPRYIPKPRTVFRISQYFGLPDRPLMRLANVTTTHSDRLRDAAMRFTKSSSRVMELSGVERAALAEFVQFLASHEDD